MGPLDANARRKGREAMETTLTRAAQVRRKLNSGRRRIHSKILSPYDAAHRIVNQANKARVWMSEAGLDPNDIRAGLLYVSQENIWEYLQLPVPEKQQEFFDRIRNLVTSGADFLPLGILWQQIDREANPGGVRVRVWIDPFVAGPFFDPYLVAAKHRMEEIIRAGGKPLDN